MKCYEFMKIINFRATKYFAILNLHQLTNRVNFPGYIEIQEFLFVCDFKYWIHSDFLVNFCYLVEITLNFFSYLI